MNTIIKADQSKLFFPNLNGLRFLGALLVFIFHIFSLGKEIWGDFTKTNWFTALSKVTSKGHHGVGLFFVLSGFLLIYLLMNEAEKKGTINVKKFLIRRVLRIWPLYFIIVLFGFLLFPYLPYGQGTDHSLLNYSVFLSNFDEIWNGAHDPLNFLTITWSVSIEEQFYLVLIFLLLVFTKLRSGKYFPIYFIVLILASFVFRFLNCHEERVMYYHTLSNISDLAIGGLSAYMVREKGLGERLKELPRWIIISIYITGIAMILGSAKIFSNELRSVERILSGLFFAFIILEQVYCTHSFYKIDRIPGFFKGGELTYGIYMYHCIFIYYWGIFFQNNGFTESFWQFIMYAIIVATSTYLTALLSMRLIEKPILRFKDQFR